MPAPKKRSITAEDLYSLQKLSDVQISPDGGHIVYRLQRVDRKTEKKYGNLWIVPSGGGEPRQFTYGDQSDSSPRWSPLSTCCSTPTCTSSTSCSASSSR